MKTVSRDFHAPGDNGRARNTTAAKPVEPAEPHNSFNGGESARVALLAVHEPALLHLLTSAFGYYGLQVVSVESGAAALTAVQHMTPALIVLDLEQPDTDGLVLCADLRARTAAPIIVCGSSEDRREALLAFRLGADDFVSKPVDVDDILARAEVAMRRKSAVPVPKASSTAPGGMRHSVGPLLPHSPVVRQPDSMLRERSPDPHNAQRRLGAAGAPPGKSLAPSSRPTRMPSMVPRSVPGDVVRMPVAPPRADRARREPGEPGRAASVSRVGALEIDHLHHRVAVGGREVRLSRSEYLLLAALMDRADELLSRLDLARAVWGEQLASVGRPIDQHMYRLRGKLQQAASAAGVAAPVIVSVPGFGYRLLANGTARAA